MSVCPDDYPWGACNTYTLHTHHPRFMINRIASLVAPPLPVPSPALRPIACFAIRATTSFLVEPACKDPCPLACACMRALHGRNVNKLHLYVTLDFERENKSDSKGSISCLCQDPRLYPLVGTFGVHLLWALMLSLWPTVSATRHLHSAAYQQAATPLKDFWK